MTGDAAVVTITQDELDGIVAAAKQLWTAALGAGDPRLAVLDNIVVLAGNLPDGMLGETMGAQIIIDMSAQGWGWFVDPSPLGNSEFPVAVASGVFAADPTSPAYGHMDLLSTVLHELGNAMGFAEDTGKDVTGMTLSAGLRRLPTGLPQPAVDASVSTGDSGASTGAPAAVAQAGGVQGLPPGLTTVLAITPPAPPAGPLPIPYPNLSATVSVASLAASDVVTGAQAAGHGAIFGEFGGSIASVGTIDWSDDFAASAPPPPASDPTADAASDAHGSRTVPPAGGAQIAWNSGDAGALDGIRSTANAATDWLDDFVNHLGQKEAQWNPNSAIRVLPTVRPRG